MLRPCSVQPLLVDQRPRHLSLTTSTVTASSAKVAWREQRRCYHALLDRKRSSYTGGAESRLIGGHQRTHFWVAAGSRRTRHSVNHFSNYFTEKVDTVDRLKVRPIRFIPTSNQAACSNSLLSSTHRLQRCHHIHQAPIPDKQSLGVV
jgi:hypothetical protein